MGAPDAGLTGSGGLPDAGPVALGPPDAGPRELPIALLAWQLDGGLAGPFDGAGGSPAELGTAARLLVQLPALTDVRVRLFDEADRVLPSDDVLEPADGGLEVRIELAKPLRPGASYRLVVDAQLGAVISGPAGARFQDQELALKVLGTPEPEPKPGKKPGKKPGRTRRR